MAGATGHTLLITSIYEKYNPLLKNELHRATGCTVKRQQNPHFLYSMYCRISALAKATAPIIFNEPGTPGHTLHDMGFYGIHDLNSTTIVAPLQKTESVGVSPEYCTYQQHTSGC